MGALELRKRLSGKALRIVDDVNVPTPKNDTLFDAGVDYLTATYVGRNTDSSLASFGRFLVQEELQRGEKWRQFYFSGYRGEQCGSAAFGVRHDSQLIRLSSKLAQEYWSQAYSLSTNVTRLDVQVTLKPDGGPTARLAQHHRQLRRKNRRRGRPAKFKIWYSQDGPEAAILGRRVSDWFGRIYDKGVESRLPEYRGSLRYEVELKRDVAVSHAALLDHQEEHEAVCVAVVSKFVTIRGLAIPAWEWNQDEPARAVSIQRSLELLQTSRQCRPELPGESELLLGQGVMRKRAAWLRNAVRPSIQMLLAQQRGDVVLEALGLSVENGTIRSRDETLWSEFGKWR